MNKMFTQPTGPVAKDTNKQGIARIFGLKKSEVVYVNPTLVLDDAKILYEPETQRCYWVGNATGSLDSWVVGSDKLTISTSTGVYDCALALISLAKEIKLAKGGSVQDALTSIHVNGFDADPTGVTDSTQAILRAVNALRTVTNSAYVEGDYRYGQVIFGEGTYLFGDVPFFSGIIYKGKGQWATRAVPLPGSNYLFTTTGTSPLGGGTDMKRLFNAGIEGMTLGCSYYETIGSIPSGVGGIRLAYASYFILKDVNMRRLNGVGLQMEEAWDMDFTNLRMMYVGNVTDSSNPVPALRMTMGTGGDGCNAIRFRGLHIEACPKSMELKPGCRHIFFLGPKIESGTVSSTIEGGAGINFSDGEFTWARNDVPQFVISRTATYESFGVMFSSCQFINGGTTPRGWMIEHTSDAGHLFISDFSAKNVKTLITGNSFKVEGGIAYSCGPNFINSTWNSFISGIVARAIQKTSTAGDAATDGTGDFIILSGSGQSIKNCHFHSNGTVTDLLAFVNITGANGDVECNGISWSGIRQYGIRNVLNTYKIRDNSTVDGGTIGSVLSTGVPKYTLVNTNASGFGTGGVNSGTVTIAAEAAGNLALVAGGTLITIRTSASVGLVSALLYVDANTPTVTIVANPSNLFATGAGTAGDGKLYLSRSGSNLVITNRAASAVTFYAVAISAVI